MAMTKGTDLADRVAVVTGGASGIGLAVVECFARQGASVVIADLDIEQASAQAESLSAEGLEVIAVRLDVAQAAEWADAANQAVRAFGAIDILINNAGVNTNQTIMATSLDSWRSTLAVNLDGVFLGIRTVAPYIRDQGGGAIVNVSSFAAYVGYHSAAYAASKWAVRGLTKTAAEEFAAWNIRVNSLHPGSVPTAMHRSTPPGHADAWRTLIPQGRLGETRELAEAALFLASERSSYMTGAELVVDGGLSAAGLARARTFLLDNRPTAADQ
jgi:3alpha(or 20beta)-hydroxysteroid dehydrogenase